MFKLESPYAKAKKKRLKSIKERNSPIITDPTYWIVMKAQMYGSSLNKRKQHVT